MSQIDRPWPPEEYDPLMVEIGRIVFLWNALEAYAKQMMLEIAGLNVPNTTNILDGAKIVAANIQSATLVSALRAAAHAHLEGDELDQVLHLAKLVDVAREYRNTYVHEISDATFDAHWEVIDGTTYVRMSNHRSRLKSTKVRARLQEREIDVTAEDVAGFRRVLQDMNTYAARVSLYLRSSRGLASQEEYGTPPEKLTVPRKMSQLHPDQ